MLHIPASRLAACLGLTGLIPFIVAASCLWLVAPAWQALFAQGLVAYGAVILAFLGAVHWGAALVYGDAPENVWRYVYGVCPALLGWVAILNQPPMGLFLLFWGLVFTFIVDRAVWKHLEWYVFLRMILTVIAGACLYGAYKAL